MAFIRPATNYIPDINFGRPLSNAQVYLMVSTATAPQKAADVNPADLLTVTYVNDAGNTITAVQPLRTTKGGCLFEGCKQEIKQFQIAENIYKVAVYDVQGNLEYQGVMNSTDGLAVVSETAPTEGLLQGLRWYKPSDAVTYVYYIDEDGGQWIEEPVQSAEGTLRTELAGAASTVLVGGVEAELLARRALASVNVVDYGVIPNSGIDQTSQIKSAIAAAGVDGLLVFPKGEYLVSEELQQMEGQYWYGMGAKRKVVFRKNANLQKVISTSLCSILENITIEDDGSSFTGGGIFVSAGSNDAKIIRCRVNRTADAGLDFADSSSSGVVVHDFYSITKDPENVPAIRLGDSPSDAFPKFFSDIWLSGGLIDLTKDRAGRDCCFNNMFIRNIVTSPITGRYYMSNVRFASLSDTTTLSGGSGHISNSAFSGPVVIDNANGLRLGNNTYGAGITETQNPQNSGNQFTSRLTSFNSNWFQDTGLQPDLGNGTLTMFYARNSDTCTVFFRLVFGSTTTPGNSAVPYKFTLPFKVPSGFFQKSANAIFIRASTPTVDYPIVVMPMAGEYAFRLLYQNQVLRHTFPVNYAEGDVIEGTFTYFVA